MYIRQCFLLGLALTLSACVGLLDGSRPLMLRSTPAIVSRAELLASIRNNGFAHPVDLSSAGLVEKIRGTFLRQYELPVREEAQVLLDHATDLMWQRSGAPERLTWMQAKTYVAGLNDVQFGGYTGWRVPTIEELASLFIMNKPPRHDVYIDKLFDERQTICWSADILDSAANVWFAYFAHGYISHTDAQSRLFVRAVRFR